MSYNHGSSSEKGRIWTRKPNSGSVENSQSATEMSAGTSSSVKRAGNTERSDAMSLRFGGLGLSPEESLTPRQKVVWKPKSEGDDIGRIQSKENTNRTLSEKSPATPSTLLHMQIKAAFYPKFVNEKSEQVVRDQMSDIVSKGTANLEVSLKHSGSLFIYSGHKGGAYARNSFGNIFTAIGVFVLGRMFRETWGNEANKKQTELNDFLEKNHMCICMKLVTAVMEELAQRPQEDYVVVTAVAELSSGMPMFFSIPDKVAFCRNWRLPMTNVWLFSSSKSVAKLFAAYDALREEGTATVVCKVLDDVCDMSVSGSIDYAKVQGDILEGLVVRLVGHDSISRMEKALLDCTQLMVKDLDIDMGPSLREVCSANRSDEKQQIRALLCSVGTSFCPDHSDWFGDEANDAYAKKTEVSIPSDFLRACPIDASTAKLKELCCLFSHKSYPITFTIYSIGGSSFYSSDMQHYKMAVHAQDDSAFVKYQKEMKSDLEYWPLYRGLFLDVHLFKSDSTIFAKIGKDRESSNGERFHASREDPLADGESNLKLVLRFLPYELHTSLLRDGLPILRDEGRAAYKAYYLKKMKSWHTSSENQWAVGKMLGEWGAYVTRKYAHKHLSSSSYLTEAECFLEQYAKCHSGNDVFVGSMGHFVKADDFLAIAEEDADQEVAPPAWSAAVEGPLPRDGCLIIFFPAIPGSAKSGICREILNSPGGLVDGRPIHCIMSDYVKGRFWQKFSDECRRNPNSIMLADKNAPSRESWMQIESICRGTGASAVPIVPDSEGTDSNPFCLDALSVFLSRVIERDYHPGNIDKASPRAGFLLLMFYHIYEGLNRKQFDYELLHLFGSIVKIPLLKADRKPLPSAVRTILEKGIDLYKLQLDRHGSYGDSLEGLYASEWFRWEKGLQKIILENSEHLNNIQVPFEAAIKQVLSQLKAIANGVHVLGGVDRRACLTIEFAAISLSVADVLNALNDLAGRSSKVVVLLKDKRTEFMNPHLLLAHKRIHGVPAVASYGPFLHKNVYVELTAILFSANAVAFEGRLGTVDGENLISKEEWPHVTLWPGKDQVSKTNRLPQLFSQGKATRVDISPPISLLGLLRFF